MEMTKYMKPLKAKLNLFSLIERGNTCKRGPAGGCLGIFPNNHRLALFLKFITSQKQRIVLSIFHS